MASKTKTSYVCSQCGYESIKWYGKCPECGKWNSMEEQVVQSGAVYGSVTVEKGRGSTLTPRQLAGIDASEEQRYLTGVKELDRVLGGGIVQGSLVLVGGDPGIGKSTLMLQICQSLGKRYKILYVSGEESERQLKLRANRLKVSAEGLYVLSNNDMEAILSLIQSFRPEIVIIDSIQTMSLSGISSSPGSVTQVRECTQTFAKVAKSLDIPIFLIGHVNKDGAIAGPKILEHMVDAVLYFEGEKNLSYRILRAVKNRYGSTNEIGVFEMLDTGLQEVENPSVMLLSSHPSGISGSCVACMLEGTRPLLAEIQALVCKTSFGTPRRMATGFDYNRTSLLLAVLEKRAGHFFGNLDVYLNVVGGLDLDEPAADLPVALSIISAYTNKVIGPEIFAFGELGLSGEIRGVSQARARVLEAQRLGFQGCILSRQDQHKLQQDSEITIELMGAENIRAVVQLFRG